MDFFNKNNENTSSLFKSLDMLYLLLMITVILIVGVIIYGIHKYFEYDDLKKAICIQHKNLNKQIKTINDNTELLKNKKKQFTNYISDNYENTDCIGKWSECDNNCKQVYSVIKPKNGKGEICDFNDGEEKECVDSTDCSPLDCQGNWSGCNDNKHKTFTITRQSQRNGEECIAENGAVDRTSCTLDDATHKVNSGGSADNVNIVNSGGTGGSADNVNIVNSGGSADNVNIVNSGGSTDNVNIVNSGGSAGTGIKDLLISMLNLFFR